VMTRLGRVRDGKMIAMRPTNAKLRDRFSRIHGAPVDGTPVDSPPVDSGDADG